MTDRDSTTRTRARAPGEEDYPPSTAVHWRVTDPTLSGIFVDTNAMHEGRKQTNTGPAHAGSRLKLTDALGRRRPKCHPSSRTGENPPYGMIGGIEETSASFEARSAPRSYPTDLHRPRAVRWRPRGRRRSVGRGEHRPAIEPRKLKPGCRRCFERGRQHEQAHHRERPLDPAWSKNLACADAPCAGTGRSRDRPFGRRRRSASGRRGAVADDARSREVRLCHSSWEADEQSGPDRSGAGGAKGGGQGECEPAKHAPDSEPGKRVTRAGAHTANRNEKNALPSYTQGGSRVPEWGPLGSVRGALSNERPYRDLRNVVANYSFETSRRFAGIQPNSGLPYYSRLSCGVGDTQLGAGFCGDLHGRWPSCGVADKARIGRDLFRSEDDPPAAKPATPIAQFALDFPCKESVCGDRGRRA